MPRPLHAIMICNPTKIQNTFATPVGADRCVGPLHTCRFRERAHTQVRPYKVTALSGTFVGSRLASTAGHNKHMQSPQNTQPFLQQTAHKKGNRCLIQRFPFLSSHICAAAD